MGNTVIAIACDHGGLELKNEAKAYFDSKNIKYVDFGTDTTASVNYPDYARKVCRAIQNNEATLGILFCGTGIGMSIAANKHRGIRAACCSDTYSAKLTRMHNNTNVLCLGGRVLGAGLGIEIIESYLNAEFEGGRHADRVKMIEDIENEQ